MVSLGPTLGYLGWFRTALNLGWLASIELAEVAVRPFCSEKCEEDLLVNTAAK